MPASAAFQWRAALALSLVYISWGTTYLAIKEGVRTLPPALFGGVRVAAAGLLLLAFLRTRGRLLPLPGRAAVWMWLCGVCMFVGGNGLITVAEKTVPSGMASVLAATFPLWLAFLEAITPWGKRLPFLSWLGLLAGFAGVGVLWLGRSETPAAVDLAGPLMVLGSAFMWALGSYLHRRRRIPIPAMQTAGWQMLLGGTSLTLLGLFLGEHHQLTAASFTPTAVFSFFYLLVVGSLVGFLAYVWLLSHVSAALAGTYAYVNPVIAILAGVVLGGEHLAGTLVAGMLVILAGVGLVRAGGVLPRQTTGVPGVGGESQGSERETLPGKGGSMAAPVALREQA